METKSLILGTKPKGIDLISSLILIVIYLSQTGLKLVLTINPYISTNSENFDVGVKGQEI